MSRQHLGSDTSSGRRRNRACTTRLVRTLLKRAALAASLALVFGATLHPAGGPNHVALAPWATRQLNGVNVAGNVVLFALPGAVLW